MALGTVLASILSKSNLNEHVVKDIKILMSAIKMMKSQFTRFVGSEDGSSQDLLLERLELWINTTPVFPVINETSKLAYMEPKYLK